MTVSGEQRRTVTDPPSHPLRDSAPGQEPQETRSALFDTALVIVNSLKIPINSIQYTLLCITVGKFVSGSVRLQLQGNNIEATHSLTHKATHLQSHTHSVQSLQ